ncbi:LOW QUALITY PROTEIN: olfactory receptor 1I1 [Rhynchonycteris naso]
MISCIESWDRRKTLVGKLVNSEVWSLAKQSYVNRHRLFVEPENQTAVSEFLLLGLSEAPNLQPLVFGLFLSMYLDCVGNLLIVLAVSSDHHLHTPMYFFLCNLSLVNSFFSSSTVPKMLANLWCQSQAITFASCLAQMYAFHLFGTMDSFLLVVMAIDQSVAIVYPLCCSVIMNPHVCGLWLITNIQSLVPTCFMAQLTCANSKISHFFFDLMPLLKLSCLDMHTNTLVTFAFHILMGEPLSCILLSCLISQVVFKISSVQGKWKAFSNCGSQLTMVSLFYGTIFTVYLQPTSLTSSQKDNTVALMCGVVILMLSPFICSLRNKDMKTALRKLNNRLSVLGQNRY